MKRIIPVLVLALVVAAVFIVIKRGGQGPGTNTLLLSGNVEATEVDLGFKTPGRVEELRADEGDRVEKGDLLATIEKTELQSERASARARLFEAKAAFSELKSGSRPQELKQAASGVRLAHAELEDARKDLERGRLLFTSGAISEARFDSLKKSYAVSRARYDTAVERQSLVAEGPREEDIRAAGFRVEAAEAALGAVSARLADTSIVSPTTGVVLKRNSEPGETVGAGFPVYTIGELENPWIKVYVKETALGRVKLGERAEVSTDSYPGKTYEGVVSYIASEAEFTPKNVQTTEERVKLVFGVKVRVENPEGELKPGMPADVVIRLE